MTAPQAILDVIGVLGMDPSLRRTGYCFAYYNLRTGRLDVQSISLVGTAKTKAKNVRRSNDDLTCAGELHRDLHQRLLAVDVVCCEVPAGSQSARASLCAGVMIGVIASIERPVIHVTPNMVKMATVGKKDATKEQIIAWAKRRYPTLGWLTHHGKPVADNEHLADAIGAIYAAAQTKEFMEYVDLMRRVRKAA